MSNQSKMNASVLKDVLRTLTFVCLFAVPFLTLYVENSYFFPFITGKNFAFRILVEVATMAWLGLMLLDATYRPRFSWILGTFGIFLLVMFVADTHGIDPHASFWSNYERMDGYVTLVHVFLYFILLGSTLRTPKLWSYFLHTSIVVACIVALKGLSQLAGGGVRVDSTLGNAAYMAVYMLFHIFFLFYLLVRANNRVYRVTYILLSILFVFVLLQTGTRGTAIGLVVGIFVTTAYLAIFGTQYRTLRKYAVGSLALLILGIGGFIAVRDTALVQHDPALARIANISIDKDLTIRTVIWGMAAKGLQEKPLLGWGQSNFNYVFNAQYDPRMYGQEQWFDRAHNIVFDWLVAGGIIGFAAYLSIFGAILYYLIWRPVFQPDDSMTVLERGVILGLVAGYLTHNLVVFDNIVSYIFFAAVLGLIHNRVATEIPTLTRIKIPLPIVQQVAMPIIFIVTIGVVYVVNVPSMLAAHDVLAALQSKDRTEQLTIFDRALRRGSFAQQEITEQFTQVAMTVAGPSSRAPADLQAKYKQQSESHLIDLINSKPPDARLYVFLGGYYRTVGNLTKAQTALAKARTLSPDKQAIIIQQAAIELLLGNKTAARDFFKDAFELDKTYDDARLYYVASLFMTNATDTATNIIADGPTGFADKFAASDFALGSVNEAHDLDYLAQLYEMRLKKDPSVVQNWASLSYVYYEMKENDKAIDVLVRAEKAIPDFANTAQCIIDNITSGHNPQASCTK